MSRSPTEGVVTLGHGSGGQRTHDLVATLFRPRLANPILDALGDAGLLPALAGGLALTTDSFVVSPLFFRGGDIGSLAVFGTVNDLAVSGAVPRFLTLGVILEEGLALSVLERVVVSIAAAAKRAGVVVVTGDTKVVERGKGDQLFVNTAGLGPLRPGYPRTDRGGAPGDVLLVSGPVGDHGAVILAARGGIGLDLDLDSDAAPVTRLVDALFDAGTVPLFMRDPTRGGLAGVLCDLAAHTGHDVVVDEAAIPLSQGVEAMGEILGVDPLHLACEGRVVALVDGRDGAGALAAWHAAGGTGAAAIGRLEPAAGAPRVVLRTRSGGARLVVRPTAELLPRIC